MMLCSTLNAAELQHSFSSPAFSGIGYSSHVLTIKQLEDQQKDRNKVMLDIYFQTKKIDDEIKIKQRRASMYKHIYLVSSNKTQINRAAMLTEYLYYLYIINMLFL